MSYEEDIAWGIQQMLDADLQFPQDVPDTNVVKTNADHIRSMTDEELADTIHAVSLGWKGQTNWCDFHCENPGEDGCDKCILSWLKQPFKEYT
jgi:hypothetical protein